MASKQIETIQPVERVNARIKLPGSKSVTHRALLMAALADGESRIENALDAEDTRLTAGALKALGVSIDEEDGVLGIAPPERRWREPEEPIWLGNSGTSMRLLLAVAAAGKGRFVLDGTARLRERPVGPIVDSLRAMGVGLRYLGRPGYPPVEVTGEGLRGGEASVDARQSSQFLSALLAVAPCADREVTVTWKEPVASFPYVGITLAMMEQWGIRYEWDGPDRIVVPAPQLYRGRSYTVEGDCSSASYFWGAAVLTGGEIFTYPLAPEALQGDCRFLEVLEKMGASVGREEDGVRVTGPGALKPVDVDLNAMPDMVPTLAVLTAFAWGRSRIRNVAHLRIKESDRLHVVASELAKMGVAAEELEDGLGIRGGSPRGAAIEAHDDHRIAMAFAMAGLRIPGVEIHGAEAVAKSFPSFWDIFRGLYS